MGMLRRSQSHVETCCFERLPVGCCILDSTLISAAAVYSRNREILAAFLSAFLHRWHRHGWRSHLCPWVQVAQRKETLTGNCCRGTWKGKRISLLGPLPAQAMVTTLSEKTGNVMSCLISLQGYLKGLKVLRPSNRVMKPAEEGLC